MSRKADRKTVDRVLPKEMSYMTSGQAWRWLTLKERFLLILGAHLKITIHLYSEHKPGRCAPQTLVQVTDELPPKKEDQ